MSAHSVLLLAFGQSNADVHDHGPRAVPSEHDDSPVVCPDDGWGIRGLMGRVPVAPISGFVPAGSVEPKIQSLLASAGLRFWQDNTDPDLKRVIVRSEARGGRRFLGFMQGDREIDGIFQNHDGQDSQILKNLITTIIETVAAAKSDGIPVKKIYITWLHGESDRAMPRADYRTLLTTLMETVEAAIAGVGVELEWLLVQSSGTGTRGGGNYWPSRLAIFDVASARPNVTVVAAGYAYEMCDGSHFSQEGKLLLGEQVGRLVAHAQIGDDVTLPFLRNAKLSGATIDMTFDTDDGLLIDMTSLPAVDALAGFAVYDRQGTSLEKVEVTGDETVRLTLNKVPHIASVEVSYAYARNPVNASPAATDFPVGRGHLRSRASSPSKFVPGKKLYDWAAGFHLTGQDLQHDE